MIVDASTLNRLRFVVWPALESGYDLPMGLLNAIATWETRGTFRDETGAAGGRGIFQLTPIALEQVRRDVGVNFDPSNAYSASGNLLSGFAQNPTVNSALNNAFGVQSSAPKYQIINGQLVQVS
jgi:hypothetical protein